MENMKKALRTLPPSVALSVGEKSNSEGKNLTGTGSESPSIEWKRTMVYVSSDGLGEGVNYNVFLKRT